jgi:hypothetical protein
MIPTMRSTFAVSSFALPLVALVALVCSCGSKPPPPASTPPSPSASVAVAPPPPPPPPKCESLDEKCVGATGKRARVVLSRLSFEPPPGWAFAQESELTIASSGAARLALAVYDAAPNEKDEKATAKNRDAVLAKLLQRLSVTPPAKKAMPWSAKPDKTTVAGALKISLWQLDGASADKLHGPIVLAHAKMTGPGGVAGVIAVGFVPDDDKAGSDGAILSAIDSLHDEPAVADAKPSQPSGGASP